MNFRYGERIEKFLIFSIFIIGILVVFSVVPNSFSISLVGSFLSFCWFIFSLENKSSYLSCYYIQEKKFFVAFHIWLILIIVASAIYAYARFITPGYDLYWFAQAVTNAKIGNGLHTSSERIYPTLLVQHWEPILYTVVPFTYIFTGAVSAVIWQALGFYGGSFGAWKICQFIFDKSENKNLKYLATILFIVGWTTINPLSFDVHPPVFGASLFIPWIIYFLLKDNKIISFVLLILLVQCGEIFFAIVPAYFVFFILEKNITLLKIIFSVILYISGFLLIGVYQKYIGPWWTGLPFNFAGRYGAIGGDGIGILQMFIHHPWQVISQLFFYEKIKTFIKLIVYYGLLPFFSIFSKKYRLLIVTIWLGCIPYFVQVGLTSDANMFSTNTHYIASISTQWWSLSIFGIYVLSEKWKKVALINRIFSQNLILPIFLIFFFLNSSEWRKSPIYPYRGFMERDRVNTETRHFLNSLPKEKGIIFAGTEWLCPLAADERKYELCESGGENFIPVMDLNVIVASKEGLKLMYNKLPDIVKESKNAKVINSIINNNLDSIQWKLVFDKIQYRDQNGFVHYYIWENRH